MRRVETFECDVAGPIAAVLIPTSDKCYTFCDVTNDRRPNFDGLG